MSVILFFMFEQYSINWNYLVQTIIYCETSSLSCVSNTLTLAYSIICACNSTGSPTQEDSDSSIQEIERASKKRKGEAVKKSDWTKPGAIPYVLALPAPFFGNASH